MSNEQPFVKGRKAMEVTRSETTAGRLRSPITWFGGKGNMIAKLLPLVPIHKTYVEPFAGAASLLFAKEPSPVEIINDLDSGIVSLFRILRDPERFVRFHNYAALTPFSREEYVVCKDTWKECADEIERAYRWYVVARMSFSGLFGSSWGYSITTSARGMASSCSRWMGVLELLPQICDRLMRVQIEHADFRNIISRYDTPQTFFYCDPPYILETRKSGGYAHEMTLQDHRNLVDLLLTVRGKVMLSGYNHAVYYDLE